MYLLIICEQDIPGFRTLTSLAYPPFPQPSGYYQATREERKWEYGRPFDRHGVANLQAGEQAAGWKINRTGEIRLTANKEPVLWERRSQLKTPHYSILKALSRKAASQSPCGDSIGASCCPKPSQARQQTTYHRWQACQATVIPLLCWEVLTVLTSYILLPLIKLLKTKILCKTNFLSL